MSSTEFPAQPLRCVLKISFDTTDDSVEQVLEVIKAVYGVDVTLARAPKPAQPQEFEPVVAESDSVQEQGLVSEPQVAAPAEEPVAAAAKQAAEATAPAKRTRSRSVAKADAAPAGKETKTEPPKKAAKKTATKKTPVNKPAAKKAASKKASAPRPRAATAETTAPAAAPGRGRGTRAAATKSAAQKSARPEAKLVRAWAREQGLENVPGRGTLPARIYEQYSAAHA
jgi:hypothetical protein